LRHTLITVRSASFIIKNYLKNKLGLLTHVGPNGSYNGEQCALLCKNNLCKM